MSKYRASNGLLWTTIFASMMAMAPDAAYAQSNTITIVSDGFRHELRLPEADAPQTLSILVPIRNKPKVRIEYTPTSGESVAISRANKGSVDSSVSVEFEIPNDGRLILDKGKLTALGTASLTLQVGKVSSTIVARSDDCSRPSSVVMVNSDAELSKGALKACIAIKKINDETSLANISSTNISIVPKASDRLGKASLTTTLRQIELEGRSWLAEPDATESTVDVYYWPSSTLSQPLSVDRKAVGATNGDAGLTNLARAILSGICLQHPGVWGGVNPPWNRSGQEMLYLSLEGEQRERVAWKKQSTGPSSFHYCANLSVSSASGKKILQTLQTQIAGGSEVNATVEYSTDGTNFQTIGEWIIPDEDVGFVDALALGADGAKVDTFDVNVPIAASLRKICLKPDAVVGPTITINGDDLTIVDANDVAVLRFHDKIALEVQSSLSGYRCFSVPRGTDVQNSLSHPEDGIYIAYKGKKLNESALAPRYMSAFLPRHAPARTVVALGLESALRSDLKSAGLPNSSVVARAQVPFFGFYASIPRKVSLSADVGAALSFRYTSNAGDSIVGASMALYVGACLRVEVVVPVPQACGAIGPTVVVGQRIASSGAEPKLGVDGQLGGIFMVGVGFK